MKEIILRKDEYISKHIDIIIKEILEHKKVILKSPTNTGKTRMMNDVELLKNFSKIYILLPNVMMVDGVFSDIGAGVKIKSTNPIEYNDNGNDRLIVINYDQYKKLKIEETDLIVIDEVHTLMTQSNFRNIMKIIQYKIITKCKYVLMLSATPLNYAEYMKFINKEKIFEMKTKLDYDRGTINYKISSTPKVDLYKLIVSKLNNKRIMVYANDKDLYDKYSEQLVSEGLLSLNQIQIITKDTDFNTIQNHKGNFIYFITSSIESAVSFKGLIDVFIGLIDGRISPPSYIQAANRERLYEGVDYYAIVSAHSMLFRKTNDVDKEYRKMLKSKYKEVHDIINTISGVVTSSESTILLNILENKLGVSLRTKNGSVQFEPIEIFNKIYNDVILCNNDTLRLFFESNYYSTNIIKEKVKGNSDRINKKKTEFIEYINMNEQYILSVFSKIDIYNWDARKVMGIIYEKQTFNFKEFKTDTFQFIEYHLDLFLIYFFHKWFFGYNYNVIKDIFYKNKYKTIYQLYYMLVLMNKLVYYEKQYDLLLINNNRYTSRMDIYKDLKELFYHPVMNAFNDKSLRDIFNSAFMIKKRKDNSYYLKINNFIKYKESDKFKDIFLIDMF